MLGRIIAFVMSFIMSVSGSAFSLVGAAIDSVFELVCGIPYTASAVKDDFLSAIGAENVGFIDDETGYVKDTFAVFLDPDLSFFERLNILKSCGGAVVGWCAPAELYVIRTFGMTHDEAVAKCEKIEATEGISLAMPLYLSKVEEQFTPDDPFNYEIEDEVFDMESPVVWDELHPYGRNWWLEAIHAREAWDYEAYFQEVNLGVLDSGFDLTHPELEGKISFPNTKRANKNRTSAHGCHVAGIIAAERNNATGISGICDNANLICVDWNPDVFQFWFTEIAIYYGFTEVVQAGAKVVNLSLGISSSITGDRAGFIDRQIKPRAMSLAMASLLSKGYDFVVVQSAGNGNAYGDPIDSVNNGHFTSITENNVYTGKHDVSEEDILNRILVVSATTNGLDGVNYLAGYSNVGGYVDIAAPGTDIFSCCDPWYGDYIHLSGTSMSAPCVTGVAGLVWSVNPSFTGAEVAEIIVNSTDSVAQINEFNSYYYDLDVYEYPMLNAKLAVEEAIRRTDDTVGNVKGVVTSDTAEYIEFGGTKYTVLNDGSFSFVAPSGSGVAVARNYFGDVICSFEITVSAKETIDLGNI